MASPFKLNAIKCCAEEVSSLDGKSYVPIQGPSASNPVCKLLVFRVWICNERDSETYRDFYIIVPTERLFFISMKLKKSPDEIVPWTEWGPPNARCLMGDTIYELGGVHVFRACTQKYILDFNQVDIARDLSRGLKENIITEPTIGDS